MELLWLFEPIASARLLTGLPETARISRGKSLAVADVSWA